MASDIELLLETLDDLSDRELQKFKTIFLSQISSEGRYSVIPWRQLDTPDRQDIVFSMVRSYGQQSVARTKEFLMKMNRTDLVQRLSDSRSGPKSKTIRTKTSS